MNKKILALLLTLALCLGLAVPAFAEPGYSPDGVTCVGSSCHPEGFGPAASQAPEAAETVEDPTAASAPEEEGAEPYGEAAAQMAGILMEEMFPEETETGTEASDADGQADEGFTSRLLEALTALFTAFMRLLSLLIG